MKMDDLIPQIDKTCKRQTFLPDIAKVVIVLFLFLAQTVSAYDPEGHKGAGGHHGYGRPKGPPSDIPAHIKERTSADGTGVNLNN